MCIIFLIFYEDRKQANHIFCFLNPCTDMLNWLASSVELPLEQKISQKIKM